MTKQNAHITSATENEIFAARLRTFADLVEQNKITSAVVYAVVDGLSPTAEFNSPLHPDVFAGQFCNCSEEDYSGFLDDMYTWVRSVLRNREARKAVAPGNDACGHDTLDEHFDDIGVRSTFDLRAEAQAEWA